ncbi:MAG: PEP-CTERM sorting domain-containing protein [Cytophagales bacterium]|nr:PEP-CTERM sorting domain-containing protein [Armatimonadota bacterium]
MIQRHPFLRRSRWSAAAALSLGALALAGVATPSARAQSVGVSALFTQTGSLFNYNFSVANNTPFTLADVNFVVSAGTALTNVSAPTGFQIVFDSGSGFVDFLADNDPATAQDFFANSTTSGFFFSSPVQLNGTAFEALDVQGGSFTGNITTAVAPEPGTLGLLAFAGVPVAAALLSRRRRFAASRSLKG